jgi:hypothetical protein
MKTNQMVWLLAVIGLMVGCATVYDVKYDYDKQTDFAALKTYDWMDVPAEATMNTLIIERIKKAVDVELMSKGLERSSENPDFLIAEHTGSREKIQVNDWGYGYSSHGRYWGGYWGPRNVTTYEYEEGWLILDFVDAASKNLIWRGTAKAEIQNVDTPEKSAALIKKAVNKILGKYPPKAE